MWISISYTRKFHYYPKAASEKLSSVFSSAKVGFFIYFLVAENDITCCCVHHFPLFSFDFILLLAFLNAIYFFHLLHSFVFAIYVQAFLIIMKPATCL
jgi:hypothetical protein